MPAGGTSAPVAAQAVPIVDLPENLVTVGLRMDSPTIVLQHAATYVRLKA